MEKLLNLFTLKPVNYIESEGFFKKAFRFMFLFAALVIALYGIYSIIYGSYSYFKMVFDLEAFAIIRHLLLFVICLIISVLAYVLIVGALYHRANLVLQENEHNLVDIMPGAIKTLGIVLAIIPIVVGLVGFFSALLAATPFFPMQELTGIISGITVINLPSVLSGFGVQDFEAYAKQLFGMGCVVLILSVFASFINLVAMYLVSALYKLVVIFIRK